MEDVFGKYFYKVFNVRGKLVQATCLASASKNGA